MFETIYVSRHAKARAQEVWPCIGVRGIRRMLVETFEVDRGLAASFLGRRLEDVADIYRVAPDLTGLFVIIRGDWRGPVVVTFIRFGPEQRRVAAGLWPKRVAA
jgi:hypothetical protein